MTVYYVDGAVGNDSNDGLAEGPGNAWATIQKAANTMAYVAVGGPPYDRAYVKASVTYYEDVVFNTNHVEPTQSGTGVAFVGYSTVPGDNGKVTISPAARGFRTTGSSGVGFQIYNFIINGATTIGIDFSTANYTRVYNCEVINTTGVYAVVMNGSQSSLINSIIAYNTNTINSMNAANYGVQIYGCVFHDNSAAQNSINGTGLVQNSIFYNNIGTLTGAEVTAQVVINNVFDGSSGTASKAISQLYNGRIMNNIITDYAVGVYFGAPGMGNGDYNLMHNVTTHYTDFLDDIGPFSNYEIGAHDIYTDPLFVDKVNHDYRLASGSPAIDAGLGAIL